MNEETTQVNVEVDAGLKQKAKENLEYGGLKRVVSRALQRVAYGEGKAKKDRLKQDLKDLREERQKKMNERNEIDNRLDEIETEMEHIEDQIDEIRDKEGEFEGYLSALDQQINQGNRVFVGHGMVEEAAELGGCTQQDIIDELKERNPEALPSQFTDGLQHNTTQHNKT